MLKFVLSGCVAISIVASLARAAEKSTGVKRPPILAPGSDTSNPRSKKQPSVKFPVAVTAPFDALVTRRRSVHYAALAKLVERGHELAASAAAEARRLDKLPEHKNAGVQEVLDSVVVSLNTLCAEHATMLNWKKGLPKKADAVKGRTVDMTCKNLAVKKLLAKAEKGWGVKIELSPLARKLKATLDVDIDGAPTLKQFLDWLAADQALTYGRVGDKLVLVPACSVKLKKAIDAGAKKKPKTGGKN